MSNTSRDYERELSLIMNAIAESVAQTSADAIWSECREDGIDVDAITHRTQTALAEAIKRHKQQKLHQARATYEASVTSMQKRIYPLPQSIQKKRDLLETILSMKPEFQGILTVAARDFRELADVDVELVLKQLQELGALDDLPSKDNSR